MVILLAGETRHLMSTLWMAKPTKGYIMQYYTDKLAKRNRQIRHFRRRLAELMDHLEGVSIPKELEKWAKEQIKKI